MPEVTDDGSPVRVEVDDNGMPVAAETDFSDVAAGHSTAKVHETGPLAAISRRLLGTESFGEAVRNYEAAQPKDIAGKVKAAVMSSPQMLPVSMAMSLPDMAREEAARIKARIEKARAAPDISTKIGQYGGAIPLIGEGAASAGETLARGDLSGGATEAALAIANGLLVGSGAKAGLRGIEAVRAAKAAKGAATVEAGAARAAVPAEAEALVPSEPPAVPAVAAAADEVPIKAKPPPPDPSISATPLAPEVPPVGDPVPVAPVADVDSALRKLSENIASAKTASAATRQLQSNELAKRFAKAERTLAAGPGGEGSLGAAKGALRGELPRAQYEPIAHLFSKKERGLLFDAIEKQPILTMPEKIRAYDALKKVMDAGSVPQPNEIALLGRALGPDVAEAITAKTRTLTESLIAKAWNIPRTLLSGPDMSMILRQAKVATSGHPIIAARNVGKGARAWVEGLGKNPGKTYEATLEAIRSRPNAKGASPGMPGLYDLSDLNFTFKSGVGELAASEEQFLRNNVVNKIPGLGRLYKASEESALTFLNKMRADVFDSIAKPYLQAGKTFESDPELFKGIARWTNITTGRGGLGPLERVANELATVLFAPRLASANFQLLSPTTYVALYRANPRLFYTAVKDMTAYAASRATIIAGAAMAGADVNDDPRSAEFGKIRVGRARLDLWGGEIQVARFGAQMATGERTKLSGERVSYDRMEQVGNYLMQRRHPSLKFVMNAISQKGDMGDTYEFHKELAELLSALPAQDLVALEKEQPNAMWMMIPGVLGAGANVYDEPAVLSAKDKTDMRAAEAARDTARQLGQEIEARRPRKQEPSPQERRMNADLTVKRRKIELEIWDLLEDHHFAKARAVARQANRQYGFEFKVDKMYRAKRLQQPANVADATP